jgi:RNA polymerase sigma-70 factor (ECF subfamily)
MRHSEREFQELYHAFRPKILRYLARLVGENEAEDLSQEVFLRVSRALKDFEGRSQLSTWVYRIATNVAVDRLRSPSFKRLHQASATPPAPDVEGNAEAQTTWAAQRPPSIEGALISKEMWDCIQEFVDKLSVNYRTVVLLSDLEGMKNSEIAEILGVSLATVKIRLHHGRSKLRKEFERHCGLYRDARNRLAWSGKRP